MNRKRYFYVFGCCIFIGLFFSSCTLEDSSPPDARTLKIWEQEQLYPHVALALRAAQTAYNVKRYDLATSCFENVISLHNTDEIQDALDEADLYQYADCLEKTGKIDASKLYFQRAFDELSEFYPNHTLLDELQARSYKKSN